MDISIIGLSDQNTLYSVLVDNKIINLKNNHKFKIDINKYNYFKIIYQNNNTINNISNFIQFTYDNDHYPIIFNPSWNSININNSVYSENIFYNLINYKFQKIDKIDTINQLNCLCADLTRPYFLPHITIKIADKYSFVFDNWTGNNQIWLSRNESSFACMLLGLSKCYLTCSINLPSKCGANKYEFYSEYMHDTPHDELFRVDCFELKPEFNKIKPINFPTLSDDSCEIDINTLSEQVTISTQYNNV